MKQQKDLLTGELFTPSRITQKFANEQNRIKYHNQKANSIRHNKMHVDAPLRINLRILTELLSSKNEATFHKEFLLGKGYTFGVLTHYINFEKDTMLCLYHFMIKPIAGDQITIIKIKPQHA